MSVPSFRNDRSYETKQRVQVSVVPYQQGGQEHTTGGPSWSFDKAMTRETG